MNPLIQRLIKWSLRRRLVVFAAMMTVLIVSLLSTVAGVRTWNEIVAIQQQRLAQQAVGLAHNLEAIIDAERVRVDNLASTPLLRSFISVDQATRSLLLPEVIATLDSFLASSTNYQALALVDDQGQTLVATDPDYYGYSFTNRPEFESALLGYVNFSDLSISPITGEPVFYVSAPLHDTTGGAIRGVLIARLSPEILWAPVESTLVGERGYAAVYDFYGICIAHGLTRNAILRPLAPLPKEVESTLIKQRYGGMPIPEDLGNPELAKLMFGTAPPKNFVLPNPITGRPVYYGTAWTLHTSFGVLVMLPAEELLRTPRSILSWLLTTGGALLIFGITIVSIVALWLTGPVQQITETIQRLAAGDLSARVGTLPVSTPPEYRLLAETFDTMAQQVEEAQAGLETLVAQRTAELEAERERLATALEELRESQIVIRRLSSPVIPVFEQVVVMPLIGEIDAPRAEQMLDSLLEGIQRYDARIALLDVTGVPTIDSDVADALIQAIEGARMLGAECVLVGIRPEVAQTVVDLGLEIAGIPTQTDLESGLLYALERLGYYVSATRVQ